VRTIIVLGAVFGAALTGAWISIAPSPATPLEYAYSDDPKKNVFEIIMPEDRQICIVDDLNHRNGPVADPVKKYWDVEGAHWIIGLSDSGETLFHYSVLSRTRSLKIPVAAKSYCEARKAGEIIQTGVRFDDHTGIWYLKLNAVI
jgi:hypothetical protein